MSTMIVEVYDALLEAGASEEKSRKAAETLATNENRFDRFEGSMAREFAEVRREIAESKVDIIKSIAAMLVAQAGFVAALVKLL